ncbi:hypothetical protein RvY_06265-2 [Ramazzottius varieornatus]|uniref:Uncharacterized protein n=1 Tax=Ramazzottius varieornatus TaxID=947166 RepID=A0A1D1UXZ0_RAMVA|nr:hypothetical protein RvY_06265-2 [Ramazzottius varieornatus]
MWKWKSIGALGTFAGSTYFVADSRLVHAKSSPEQADYISMPPGMTTRTHLQPAFDTHGAIRGEGMARPELAEMQLRHVQVFFRHGARTPLRILTWMDQPEWPKDKILGDPPLPAVTYTTTDVHGQLVPSGPYEAMYQKIIFKGGTPAGQLTKTGKEQVYELGRRIRGDYIEKRHLIAPTFNASEVYVRSTNMMRTIESARWLLSGIFGHNKRGDKIIIHTEPAEREILYPNHSFCRQLKLFNKKLFKELDASIPGLREDRAQLQRLLGTPLLTQHSSARLSFLVCPLHFSFRIQRGG